MTRKHYKAIADIIAQSKENAGEATTVVLAVLTIKLSHFFVQENPRFDKVRFMKACGFTVST